jgi:hypothetical protein
MNLNEYDAVFRNLAGRIECSLGCQCAGRVSNTGSPEYKAGVLPARTVRAVSLLPYFIQMLKWNLGKQGVKRVIISASSEYSPVDGF